MTQTGRMWSFMLQAKKIPVSELENFKGIVAEDIVSQSRALILPRGSNLSWLSSSAIQSLSTRLTLEGVEYVSVYLDDVDLSVEPLESANEPKLPVKQINNTLVHQTIRQIGDLYNRIASGEVAHDMYEPLFTTGRILAQEVISSEVITLSLAKVKEKDEYTFVHSLNVALLSGFLARKLQGNDKSLIEDVVIGGLLHDVGKAKIPLEILNKPGPLTDEEYAIMKEHPVLGLEILKEAAINDETILSVTLYHHERMDGKGYPRQLRGGFIPFVARIAAVADVFDAVTTSRVYRTAESLYFAVSLIIKETNKHFDPKVARELISALGLYPPGTVVELSDDSTAVVISSNLGDLLRPVVLVLYDAEGILITQSRPIDLKETPNLYIKRVVGNYSK